MLQGVQSYRIAHSSDDKKTWIIHGLSYRVTPELEQYLTAMVAYHRRQAMRHERAVGRWWIYITPESPPTPPPVVPPDEAMGGL
jgi:hypothetical protein